MDTIYAFIRDIVEQYKRLITDKPSGMDEREQTTCAYCGGTVND